MKKPNLGGRPPIWETPEQLNEDIDKYIAFIRENPTKLANKTGFAIFKGIDRATVDDYLANKGPQFSRAIKRILAFSEEQCIEKCFSSTTQVAGTVFLLKNLHKYTDKQEVESINKTEHSVSDDTLLKLQQSEEGRSLLEKMYKIIKND